MFTKHSSTLRFQILYAQKKGEGEQKLHLVQKIVTRRSYHFIASFQDEFVKIQGHIDEKSCSIIMYNNDSNCFR
jgi:hypothetical protein